MNWSAHFFIGAALGSIFSALLGFSPFMIILISLVAGVSALAPDIDHDSSKIRRIADLTVPLFALLFSVSSRCAYLSCSLDAWQTILTSALALVGGYTIVLTYLKPKHRGIIHSLAFAVIYGLLLLTISDFTFALFGFLGYFSHLVADGIFKLL
ncbi:MAG: metal-dependent hydrolase [Candidatus Bilamarchaeaceae archaeon]